MKFWIQLIKPTMKIFVINLKVSTELILCDLILIRAYIKFLQPFGKEMPVKCQGVLWTSDLSWYLFSCVTVFNVANAAHRTQVTQPFVLVQSAVRKTGRRSVCFIKMENQAKDTNVYYVKITFFGMWCHVVWQIGTKLYGITSRKTLTITFTTVTEVCVSRRNRKVSTHIP